MYKYEKKSREEILEKHYEQAINGNIKLVDENSMLKKEINYFKQKINSIYEMICNNNYDRNKIKKFIEEK